MLPLEVKGPRLSDLKPLIMNIGMKSKLDKLAANIEGRIIQGGWRNSAILRRFLLTLSDNSGAGNLDRQLLLPFASLEISK